MEFPPLNTAENILPTHLQTQKIMLPWKSKRCSSGFSQVQSQLLILRHKGKLKKGPKAWLQLNERQKTQRTLWHLKLSMFEFQFSFYPRIWNMPSLVSRFISGTPFTLQTSTGKTKPKKTYKQNPVFHFSHTTETTVVLKNLKNKILLLLCSVLGKIWPNQMYTGLPGQGTWDIVLYCHLVSPARALTWAPAHILLFIPCPFFFLPVTSCRATAPPCFVPRTEAQTAWFRMPFLFLWSCRVCFSF